MLLSCIRYLVLIGLFLTSPAYSAKQPPVLDAHKPLLLGGKNYTEYWDQYFIFDDGTLLTTQYLIGTFPFMKHKGIVLSTLVKPDGTRYIIKNGRNRSGWTYAENKLDLSIFQHKLSQDSLKLHNTTGEVRIDFETPLPGFDLAPFSPGKGKYMLTSVYAPHIRAEGQWQRGPNSGGGKDEPWQKLEGGHGFGMHVLLDGPVDNFMDSWIRVFGFGGTENIILSSITRPDGSQENILKLYRNDEFIRDFTDVELTISEMAKDKKMGEYPGLITIRAKDGDATLDGTITFTKKLDHFRLRDHLSTLERMISKIFPSLIRYRYLADYNMVYKSAQGETQINGRALSEYTDVVPARAKKKKKRRRK